MSYHTSLHVGTNVIYVYFNHPISYALIILSILLYLYIYIYITLDTNLEMLLLRYNTTYSSSGTRDRRCLISRTPHHWLLLHMFSIKIRIEIRFYVIWKCINTCLIPILNLNAVGITIIISCVVISTSTTVAITTSYLLIITWVGKTIKRNILQILSK